MCHLEAIIHAVFFIHDHWTSTIFPSEQDQRQRSGHELTGSEHCPYTNVGLANYLHSIPTYLLMRCK